MATSTRKAATKAATTTPAAPKRAGIGNTPPTSGPVVPTNLAGVVTTTTPAPAATATSAPAPAATTTPAGRPRRTAAALAATMAAKATTKAVQAPKAAPAPAGAKAATAPTGNAAVAARKAATAQRNAATQQVCLDFLTKHAGTAYSVKGVEDGTGNGPTSGKIKTLRPALWALVKAGKIQGPDNGLKDAKGHKGFMVPAPAAPKAPRKAATPAKATPKAATAK